jgi:succinyl-diaminopimelate desuccinylase
VENVVAQHLEKEILELTEALIRIPSTQTRPGKISECASFIAQWLGKHGINYKRYDENDVPSIVVMPSEATETKILLMAHFDVVEAESDAAFSPRIEDGKLYGRGAIDDKYAVALSLILFREHLSTLYKQGLTQREMSFGLLLTGDEEVGGRDGVGKVGQIIHPDFFIALDGGRPGLIVTKEKGTLLINLEATGKAGHAARPWLGKNAFDILTKDYMKLLSLFSERTDDHWHKTMVLSQCKAGNGSTNIIPEKASATLDIRYTEHDNPDEIIASIREVVASKVEVQGKEPMFFGGSSLYFPTLKKHANGAVFGFEHGASDARYLSTRDIPGAIWGADGEMSQHTDEEHIVLDSLYGLFESLDSFLKETAES